MVGFKWDMGAGVSEGTLNVGRLNKWTDRIVPVSGSSQFLSGPNTQESNELSGGVLYVLISPNAINVASSGSSGMTLGAGDMYWPADEPLYHFVRSGSTSFVAVRDFAGGAVTASLAPIEHTEEG